MVFFMNHECLKCSIAYSNACSHTHNGTFNFILLCFETALSTQNVILYAPILYKTNLLLSFHTDTETSAYECRSYTIGHIKVGNRCNSIESKLLKKKQPIDLDKFNEIGARYTVCFENRMNQRI